MILFFFKNKNLFQKLFFAILISLFLTACFLSKQYRLKKDEANYFRNETPPGCIKLKDNFYYDKTEVTNLDWLEYLYWTRRVFGADSMYTAALPDSNVWVKKDICLQVIKEMVIHKKDTLYYIYSFPECYLRHPMYRDYPVVGITQQQAENYSKWRADRVFEYTLIKYGILKMNPEQNGNNYFSIENYFNGKYNGYVPDPNFRYYPDYRLPTKEEWKYALNYSDSVRKSNCMKKPKKKQDAYMKDVMSIQSDIVPCQNNIFSKAPTVPAPSYYGPIYNLRGNVSEWTSEDGVTVGGGWADSKERILACDTFHLKTKNAWTSFRNVCEWKEWKK